MRPTSFNRGSSILDMEISNNDSFFLYEDKTTKDLLKRLKELEESTKRKI
jgi:hypothetical protein